MMKKRVDSLMKEGNISLILDSYDDIFSDFDPRPFESRALSDDFLLECKKATVDKDNEIELRFLIPIDERNIEDEIKIKKRLRAHFQKHYFEKHREIRKIKVHGILWFIVGAIIMFIGTFLYKMEGYLFNFLFILSEPAGWFFFWEGLSKIFIHSKAKAPDYIFYRKMTNASIIFTEYHR